MLYIYKMYGIYPHSRPYWSLIVALQRQKSVLRKKKKKKKLMEKCEHICNRRQTRTWYFETLHLKTQLQRQEPFFNEEPG